MRYFARMGAVGGEHAFQEKSRDAGGMLFVKAILTVLSLGLAIYFGLWKVQGGAFEETVTNVLTPVC